MNIRFFYLLLTLVVATLSGVAAPSSPGSAPTYQDVVRAQWTWIYQKWTDNDKPYLRERDRIAALYRTKKIGRQQIRSAQTRAQTRPQDSVAAFSWGYTAYCYSLLQPDRSQGSGYISDVSQGLAKRRTPNSYQYARLRFLIACSPGGSAGFPYGNGPYRAQLGERLLTRNPNDQGVKGLQIDNLRTGHPEDERKAIKYAQDIVKANPKDAGAYVTLGFTYQWTSVGRQGNGPQLAIVAYEKALSLNKTPGKWRQSTQNNINELKKLVAEKS